MEAYTDFAVVYDLLMDETPYEEWAEFLIQLLKEYRLSYDETREENLRSELNTVLDLGCGTGTITRLFAEAGFEMIGIDNSGEMLAVAMEKTRKAGLDILYLNQDMREFELYGTVGAVISVCDSLNYLLSEEEILQTFRLVNNYLFPGSLFLFDFNTTYKYEEVIGDTVIAENREECSFIWENCYDRESGINEYDLTLFVKQNEEGDGGTGEELYRRVQETHYQRGYHPDQMRSLIAEAGMELVAVLDADTHGEIRPESERIYMVAREKGKGMKE